MADRIPQLKPKEFIRVLEKLGFVLRRQTGSHAVFKHPDTKRMAVVPIHANDIKRGLLFGIINQAKIPLNEVRKLLH